jgi:hypothetical protein
MDKALMKDIDVAWLAGLLEGEGCFTFNSSPFIALQMTDLDVMEKATKLMGCKLRPSKLKENRKQVYRTSLHAAKALELMRLILPFMGLRRSEKIREVMALAAARTGPLKGEKCRDSKLSDIQAAEIRSLYIKQDRKNGRNSSALARKYGVSQSAIWYTIHERRGVAEVRS